MRVAVYGGSFNPPHVGHLLVAAWVRLTGQADEVWFLPSFSHPFTKRSQPFEVRAAWCEAIAAEVPGVRVCRIEQELPAPSYTIDVLDALADRHPECEFRFVLGADLLDTVGRWKDWAGIQARYAPIVVGRQGFASPPSTTLDFPPVSSTDIRARAARGEPIEHLVPAAIASDVRRVFSVPTIERCPALSALPGIVHGFGGRSAGEDWGRLVSALDPGCAEGSVAWMTQVHGAEVVRVHEAPGPDRSVGEADAAFTTEIDVVLAVRTADCVPVLVAGPGVVGVAHAGWRGVVAGVVPSLLSAIESQAGVAPGALTTAIGPAISAAAYEVGPEVVEGLEAAEIPRERFFVDTGGPRPHVDLQSAVRYQLEARGVSRIDVVDRCTAADPDLFSYRADGPGTGRQVGLIVRRSA